MLQVKQWTATTNLARRVDEFGLAIDCSIPRDGELAAWLPRLAKARFDAQLDAAAARLLVELVGPEAGILAAEVEKLAVYAGESKRIGRDVLKLVGAGRVETIWKVLDAATTGEGRIALEHFENLLGAGEEPVGVLAAMSVSLLKIHHAGRLRAARLSLDEACRLAGIPSFAVDKTRRQHAHLGPSRVDQLPALLLRADLDLKGGAHWIPGPSSKDCSFGSPCRDPTDRSSLTLSLSQGRPLFKWIREAPAGPAGPQPVGRSLKRFGLDLENLNYLDTMVTSTARVLYLVHLSRPRFLFLIPGAIQCLPTVSTRHRPGPTCRNESTPDRARPNPQLARRRSSRTGHRERTSPFAPREAARATRGTRADLRRSLRREDHHRLIRSASAPSRNRVVPRVALM